MYGMVNEGLRTYVEKEYGPEMWGDICTTAKVDNTTFERMTTYDDAITYALVGATCEHTGKSAEDVLKLFGVHWVSFAGGSSFGTFLRLAGNTFVDRIKGLDDMHDSILLSMPHLKPPSFEIEETGEDTYLLSYYSEREGLAPMVVGLLHGLAKETGEKVDVSHVTAKENTADPDIFRVTMLG